MGIEFKLRRIDHKKVEDFVARQPSGVTAFTFDANLLRLQAAAAEAARQHGYEVLVEPLTERLTVGGFEPEGLPYYDLGEPLDVVELRTSTAARATLVAQTLDLQHELATTFVPPFFCIEDNLTARLNRRLVEKALELADRPVRPVVLVKSTFARHHGTDLADAYGELGVTRVDLRVTPLRGEDESMAKVRALYTLADAFRAAGIEPLLGCSGNIGQTGLALGHAAGFSVGIGLRERIDHTAMLTSQRRPREEDDDKPLFGPQTGVYLTGPEATVPRKVARQLLQDRQIRGRISCRIGSCADNIEGPAADPRAHYLHARAHEVAALLERPVQWRASMEADRLQRALDLRNIINAHHLPEGAHPVKTRTLHSLLEDIEVEQRHSA